MPRASERRRQDVIVARERQNQVRFSVYVSEPGERLLLGTAVVEDARAEAVHEELGRILARRRPAVPR